MRNMPRGGNSLIPFSGEAGLEAEAEDKELEARLEEGLELRLKLCRKLLDRDRTKSPNSNMIELPVDMVLYHFTVWYLDSCVANVLSQSILMDFWTILSHFWTFRLNLKQKRAE